MPKLAILDTYYPDFLKTFQVNEKSTYEAELARLLACQFGTADFYSRNLRKLGWEAIDIIANCEPLQRMWSGETYGNPSASIRAILMDQLRLEDPDVAFFQDLSFLSLDDLEDLQGEFILAAQLSCPWPGDGRVKKFQIVYTSFPHFVPRIERLGVRAVFSPLAFEPSVLSACDSAWRPADDPGDGFWLPRIHDCVFIGGVGTPSHWKRGMETLHRLAFDIPTMEFYGYGYDLLPDIRLKNGKSANQIKAKYKGHAWGREMYSILMRSKICFNRHGEVAEGYTNNLRCFEATGCGAMLLTEESKNIRDYFAEDECVTYSSPQDAVEKIRYYLSNDSERAAIAAKGQARTLCDHTYSKRMAKVSEVLTECLAIA